MQRNDSEGTGEYPQILPPRTCKDSEMGDFKKLQVWQLAHKIVCELYRDTVGFPKTEAYGLTANFVVLPHQSPPTLPKGRAAAEKFGRFVRIALGSGRNSS